MIKYWLKSWQQKKLWILPIVSKLCAFGRTPIVDTAPWDGRKPKIPQNAAGILTHPIVSVPAMTR